MNLIPQARGSSAWFRHPLGHYFPLRIQNSGFGPIQTVVLLVAAFAQDGWGAVVEDGCGFDGSQAAHGNGGSSWRI